VQVASFRDSSKAAELRDQLRGQSYPTYVNEVLLSDGSVFTQVLVGPNADIERVRQLQETIKQETGLQGLVVRYQP
jgi:DedD protein